LSTTGDSRRSFSGHSSVYLAASASVSCLAHLTLPDVFAPAPVFLYRLPAVDSFLSFPSYSILRPDTGVHRTLRNATAAKGLQGLPRVVDTPDAPLMLQYRNT
jgi:hypothetical protein